MKKSELEELVDDIRKKIKKSERKKKISMSIQTGDWDKLKQQLPKPARVKKVKKCPKCNTLYSQFSQKFWQLCGKWFCQNCDKKELARYHKILTEYGSFDPEKWESWSFYGLRRKTGNHSKYIR